MTMTDTRLDLSSLTDDGDTLELADGRVLRLKFEPDYDHSINDDEAFYGRISDEMPRRNDLGWPARPSDMSGNAEKLWYGNDGPWWWEPPAEGPKRGTPEFAKFRDDVRELLAFGYNGIILELHKSCDHCHRNNVIKSASLWGIEAMAERQYIQEVVSELASELEVA